MEFQLIKIGVTEQENHYLANTIVKLFQSSLMNVETGGQKYDVKLGIHIVTEYPPTEYLLSTKGVNDNFTSKNPVDVT